MAQWFETRLRYDKLDEQGRQKRVTESYLVDALSFSEAEARITEKRKPYISGDFTISTVKRDKISEVFYDDTADKCYKVKVAFITSNEKTGTEKRSTSIMLVQSNDFYQAYLKFIEEMKGTMADYEIIGISETAILEVYPIEPAPLKSPE